MKYLSFFVAVACSLGAFAADPVASNVVLTTPVNGVATITYDLANGPAVVTLDIEKKTGDIWASIGDARLQRLSGDVNRKVTSSSGTIGWSVDGSLDGAAYRAKVTAWPMTDTPDYMVVSLATAQNAEDRIRYYASTNALPGGLFANPAYRTTMMVFKKVMAKGIAWKMGCTSKEPTYNIYADREKQHDVTLDHNYYLAIFPATQAQCALIYGSVFGENLMIERNMRLQAKLNYATVEALVAKAVDLAGGGVDFALPTEAEWEYACRAGYGDGYWGDGSKMTMVTYTQPSSCSNLAHLGRYRNNQAEVGNVKFTDNRGPEDCTPIAGSYAPNAWGFYDMNGGVDECCQDWYQNDITSLGGAVNIDANDSTKCADGTTGEFKVARGGSWVSFAYQVRPAMRGYYNKSYYGDYQQIGLRFRARMGLE